MRDVTRVAKAVSGALVLAATLAGLSACAPPVAVGTPRSASTDIALVPTSVVVGVGDSTPPIVEAREYWGSPTVAVVGWTEDDTGLGLRTWVRRGDGSPAPEHRLFVSWFHPQLNGGVNRAAVLSGPLEVQGIAFDHHNCSGNGGCSPYVTYGVRVPDDLLRSVRDSLPVTLFGREGREMHISLRRELIASYLGVVDSVSASLKRKGSAEH